MRRLPRLSTVLLLLILHFGFSLAAQNRSVFERGTFETLPAGKHINHSYYGTWQVFFATEDGVLIYDHQAQQWQDPITASNGLNQYPALLVWQDPATQDIWIVTPDYIFVYDKLTDWMSRQELPKDANFSGIYELGVTDTSVIVTAHQEGSNLKYSAIYAKINRALLLWGSNSELSINWDDVTWIPAIDPGLISVYESLALQVVKNGSFDASGLLHLDGYPQRSVSMVTALSGDPSGSDIFLSTFGAGILHARHRDGDFKVLPYGLLTPDVMCIKQANTSMFVGGRAGLTFFQNDQVSYAEAIKDPVNDLSFVSAIDETADEVFIAAHGGIFARRQQEWSRIISKKDLKSERIYALALGDHGSVMVGTERNAFLYDTSGLILRTIFPEGLNWPVFDVSYAEGRYYLSTSYGLYIFDETNQAFIGRISSQGDYQTPQAEPALDPIYQTIIKENTLWSSTGRGLMGYDLVQSTSTLCLAPNAPFQPRGLTQTPFQVWVGTESGVFSYDVRTSTWRQYTRADGLISDFVTDLARDGDYIWVGTNLGLTRIKWPNL